MDMEDGHHGEDMPGSDTDTGDTGVVDTGDTRVSIFTLWRRTKISTV